MNAKKLATILETAFKNNFQCLIKGPPGLGKTSIIEQVAQKLGYDLITDVLSIAEPTDFKGLPGIVNGEAVFLPYANLKLLLTATKPTIYFVDDLGWANASCQNCYASLLWKREVNGQKISEHIRFVSATNNKKDNSNVNNLSLALLSRFHMIIDMDLDAPVWIEWANNNKMPAELVAYIQNKPAMLSTFTGAREEIFACPRTIANLGLIINADIIDLEAWRGCVGDKFAIEFFAYYQLVKKLGDLPSQILIDPKRSRIDLAPDLLYFVIVALNNRATDVKKFEVIMQYLERLPIEFQAFALKLITSKTPRFMETASFIQWNVKNQGIIQ